MITICNQHQTLAQLNKRWNYKMRWKIVDACLNHRQMTGEKVLRPRAMISELSWRQIIAQIFHVKSRLHIGRQDHKILKFYISYWNLFYW